MSRPEAEGAVKTLVAKANRTGTPLPVLAAEAHPGQDWARRLAPEALLGEAPAHARRFAARAKAV
jgi:3-carboxy-cis,cis-muconate cycloisomerase